MPVLSYDKFIDVKGQNEKYFICIFMNLNENVKIRGKTRKNYSHCKVLDGLKDYLASLGPYYIWSDSDALTWQLNLDT